MKLIRLVKCVQRKPIVKSRHISICVMHVLFIMVWILRADNFSPEDGDSTSLWNAGIYLKIHTALYLRRPTDVFTSVGTSYVSIFCWLSSVQFSFEKGSRMQRVTQNSVREVVLVISMPGKMVLECCSGLQCILRKNWNCVPERSFTKHTPGCHEKYLAICKISCICVSKNVWIL
jgi:hypothetical protein